MGSDERKGETGRIQQARGGGRLSDGEREGLRMTGGRWSWRGDRWREDGAAVGRRWRLGDGGVTKGIGGMARRQWRQR